MKQDDLLILLFKVVLIADLVTILSFVLVYTVLAKWWSNAIGRTIVSKDLLLAAALTPSILSFFFHFSRLTSRIAGWVDVALFAGIAVVMVWRDGVWIAVHRSKRAAAAAPEEEGEQ